MRTRYKVLVGKPERKRPLGKARHRLGMQSQTSLNMYHQKVTRIMTSLETNWKIFTTHDGNQNYHTIDLLRDVLRKEGVVY
jgi:hypothetical protein